MALADIQGTRRAHAGRVDTEMTKEPDEPGRTDNTAKRRLLLVADAHPWAKDPIAALLRHAGYEILTATTGQDTVAVFEGHAEEIVAVLMDQHMPRGGGKEVFEQLQRIKPNTPVIMMSGLVDHDTEGHFLGMGVVGFRTKPFGRTALLNAVRDALGAPAA